MNYDFAPYSLSIFDFIPLGGSIVIFIDLYSNEIEKSGWGLAESITLKFSATSNLKIVSIFVSISDNKLIERWQFAKNTQFPFADASSKIV